MLDALMRTDYKLEAIPSIKVLHAVGSKTAGVLPPRRKMNTKNAIVVSGIGPQCIKYHAVPRSGAGIYLSNNLDGLWNPPQVIQGCNRVTNSTMYAQDGSLD